MCADVQGAVRKGVPPEILVAGIGHGPPGLEARRGGAEPVALESPQSESTYHFPVIHQIIIRDGKGRKDRLTMLAGRVIEPLCQHPGRAKEIHRQHLADG